MRTAAEIIAEQARLRRREQALANLIAAADGLRALAEGQQFDVHQEYCEEECSCAVGDAVMQTYDTAKAEWEKATK